MIVVRVARVSDTDTAHQVSDAAFGRVREIYRPSPEMIVEAAKLESALIRLVAIDGDCMVGTVRYRIDGDRLRLLGLAVSPACQRRGIARALVEHLAVIASEHRCVALALYTVKQTGNVPVFHRLGFLDMWERPDAFSISMGVTDLTEVYMERAL